MTDKNSKENKENKFFDVSFDEPIQNESRTRQRNKSDNIINSTQQPESKKWDNFYEKFQEEQGGRYTIGDLDFPSADFVSHSEPNRPSEASEKLKKPTDSNIMINRSIKRVQSLFNETAKESPENYNRIKSAKGKNLKERARLNSLHSTSATSKKTKVEKASQKEDSIRYQAPTSSPILVRNSQGKEDNALFDESQLRNRKKDNLSETKVVQEVNRNIKNSDLPTPEELALERERRRKQRIEQLESMNSPKEIEESYTPLNQPWHRYERKEELMDSPQLKNQENEVSEAVSNPISEIHEKKPRASKFSRFLGNRPKNDPANINHKPESTQYTQDISGNQSDESKPQLNRENEENKDWVDDLNSIHIISPSDSSDSFNRQTDNSQNSYNDDKDWVSNLDSIHVMSPTDSIPTPSNQNRSHFDNSSDDGIDDKDWVDDLDSIHIMSPGEEDGTVVHAATPSASINQNTTNRNESNSLLPVDNVQSNKVDIDTDTLSTSVLASEPIYYDSYKDGEDLEDEEFSKKQKKKVRKQKKKDKYSLEGFSLKDRTFFGLNVIFNVVKRLLIYIIIIVILIGVMAGGAGIGYFANLVSNTPPPTEQEMREQINQLEQQSTLYYGDGELIADVRTDVVRSIANLDEISNYIVDGLIATEDEYFEEHEGIVPKALIRAVLETLLSGSGTGGSTLTQQLVKQQMLTNDVTFFRKANEILLALRLENYFSKEEILTAYLNVSPFGRNNNGDNVAGISEASQGIFGVSPEDVTLTQAAFLVGLPQDPYTYTPYDQEGSIRDSESIQYGVERMKEVLFRMYRAEKITQEEYETAIAYDITQDFLPGESRPVERQTYLYQAVMNGAIEKLMLLNIQDDGYTWQQVFSDDDWYNEYYFAAEEQLRVGGYKVYSTIDKEIYDQLNESAQAYEDQLGAVYDGVYTDPETGYETYYIERVQTGLVAIDNNTGRVLGFVAGTDFDNNQIDHAFTMRRSPGSTIKPLAVYGPAVENNLINPSTVIPDTAFVETYEDGTTWEPTNYGTVVSDTFMTARTALLRSDNLPAVRIYEELRSMGVPIIDYLERMGFNTVDSYTEEDTENLAFSLGGVTTGPTVFEQTRAFSTFANNGEYVDGYYIDRIEDAFGNIVFQQSKAPQQVFSEDSNYIMVDMLRDTMTDGTGRTANENMIVPGDWIAKSGISENSKDIWFIASTPSITIGSWIGYDSRYADYTIDVNDGYDRESVRSQLYWARIVNDLYAIRPEIFGTDETFSQPSSVREETVLEQTGTLAGTFTHNGSSYQLTGPTKTELFKVSNPAPALTFDFMLGATEEELNRFWNSVRSQQAEQYRQQQQQNQQTDGNEESDGENDEESSDSESSDGEENPDGDGGETPPAETPSDSDQS